MTRSWTDSLGQEWEVTVEEHDRPQEPGDMVLVFGRDGQRERWIDALGPLDEALPEAEDDQLQEAYDAAAAGIGILLVDENLRIWWVRGPDEALGDGPWAVKFSDGVTEVTHPGPLPDQPEALTEDELVQLLDEARGNVLLPMDITGV